MTKLFKSNITALKAVSTRLAYNRTMSGNTQIMLSPRNQDKKDRAEQLIYEAIRILDSIE